MAMLYLHVPFCAAKCAYCGFYSVAHNGRVGEVLGAMEAEVVARKDFFGGVPLRTIYVGGGTPSVLSVGELERLLVAVRGAFDCSGVEQVAVEANPEQLSADYLSGLRALGVDRLSIGVQSFSDERLRQMRRRHTAAEAVEAVVRARAAGFSNLSIDLIYGFSPMEEWEATVDRAVLLFPEHISAYHLSIEGGTLFSRQGVVASDDEQSTEQYLYLCRALSAAGYEHYEISNWARLGFRSRHNSGYWTGESYLGIGPSAHSYDGGFVRSWNTSSLVGYVQEREELTVRDRHNEWVMLSLRRAEGLDPLAYFDLFGRLFPRRDWLELTSVGWWRISELDWLVSDGLISELFI